ncbi:MAG: hypothetical protein K0V04_30230 [Deltaproteobacteria bacterium]|nr:hypothetical protein [Deltaproteobacteria bacterium]
MGKHFTVVGLLGLGLLAACEPVEPNTTRESNIGALGNDHGYVEVTLTSDSASLDGTDVVEARLHYGSGCFASFYRVSPEWSAEGERGGPIFDDAIASLCDSSDLELASCEVIDIRQELIRLSTSKLIVTFEVEGSLEGRTLRIGPLPTPTLADCDLSTGVGGGSIDAWGRNDDGAVLWQTGQVSVPLDQDRPAPLLADRP